MRTCRNKLIVGGSALLLSSACGPTEAQDYSRSPVSSERWAIGKRTIGPIGVVDEPATHALFRARRARFVGSLISVANAYSELRFFRRDGTYVGIVGRRGDGPGEFSRLSWHDHLPDGSIVANNGGRLVFLGPDGDERSRAIFEIPPDANVEPALLEAGYVVGIESVSPFGRDLTSAETPGVHVVRQPSRVILYRFDGRVERSLTEVRGVTWRISGEFYNDAPLAPRPSVAGWQDVVAVTEGDSYGIELFSLDSQRAVTLPASEVPPRATDAHLAAWIEQRRQWLMQVGAPPNVPVYRPPFDQLDIPDRLPGYWTLRFDDTGCLFAERYPIPGEASVRWDVIDPSRGVIAQLDVPTELSVTDVGPELLGLVIDDLGVETIVGFSVDGYDQAVSCAPPWSPPR